MIMNYYETSDMALATTIQLLYEPAYEIKGQGKRVTFCFKDSKELRNLVDEYWRQELRVDPLGFFGELRTIKARLYESKR